MKIEIDEAVLKPGDHLVIQKRNFPETAIEEIFRWTKPIHTQLGDFPTTTITEIKIGAKV